MSAPRSRPASQHCARSSLCVLGWLFLSFERFRSYEISRVLEVMPSQENRSASSVSRFFLAKIRGALNQTLTFFLDFPIYRTHVVGTMCYLCPRAGPIKSGRSAWI